MRQTEDGEDLQLTKYEHEANNVSKREGRGCNRHLATVVSTPAPPRSENAIWTLRSISSQSKLTISHASLSVMLPRESTITSPLSTTGEKVTVSLTHLCSSSAAAWHSKHAQAHAAPAFAFRIWHSTHHRTHKRQAAGSSCHIHRTPWAITFLASPISHTPSAMHRAAPVVLEWHGLPQQAGAGHGRRVGEVRQRQVRDSRIRSRHSLIQFPPLPFHPSFTMRNTAAPPLTNGRRGNSLTLA